MLKKGMSNLQGYAKQIKKGMSNLQRYVILYMEVTVLLHGNYLNPICCFQLPACNYLHGRLPAQKLAAQKGDYLHRRLPAQKLAAQKENLLTGNYLHGILLHALRTFAA